MDADDERQPVQFKIVRAALDAGELRAELEELGDRADLVICLRVRPDADAEQFPEGGIFSLSVRDQKEHLQILMETTQHFAKQTGYPLEMMVLQKEPEQG
jgi:hypothetical protein